MFEKANRAFVTGDLQNSKDQAKEGCEKFLKSSPQWAWKFRILEAKAALWQGLFEEVLMLLRAEPRPSQPELVIPMLTIRGVANVHIGQFPAAEDALREADELCATRPDPACGEVLQARGLLASEQGDSDSAEKLYDLSLSFARTHHDLFLESTALLNLGAESLTQGRFDEALDRSDAAYRAAKIVDARIAEQVTQGNAGWAFYRLGDSEKALGLFLDAEKSASGLGDLVDQGVWLNNAGYIYMDARNFPLAEQSFTKALVIEQRINRKEHIYNSLRALARLALQMGDLANAGKYADQALEKARESGNRGDELYPMLVQGQVAARRNDTATAESTFRKVEGDRLSPVFLKWEAEHSLARLYEDSNRYDAADHEYRIALATFESARDDVQHEDSQLSFLTNASHIYDDYVHFLVTRGKAADALRWADYSRARTLAEGLGLLAKGAAGGPPALDPQQIARLAHGTILFYWLGEKQSYLWAITPHKTSLFSLPPAAEIDAAERRYRQSLGGPEDVLASADPDGRWLYRTLVAPAQSLLEKDAKVFVVPDGSLNNLNFETLLVLEPASPRQAASSTNSSSSLPSSGRLHYWIEDVTSADASSLRVLGASRSGKNGRQTNDRATNGQITNSRKRKHDRSLLLVGNSVAVNDKYPELPRAADQMESVARHFAPDEQTVFAREAANPAAYLEGGPDRFSYIHFVAHGTASRLSPLDSAIILSKTQSSSSSLKTAPLKAASTTASSETAADASFKLYAREIIHHPLHADLVTISACHGADGRAYSGEGLVGLSWAFLRAGAHNVVAALWEVTDASTPQLMDRFYDELDKGASPDVALRAAKLQLLRSSGFRDPYYWAPFQLYAGSGS
ncbi:MAG TPA: CHAT domain-containing protein [Terriglobales bacterium]|nr:CHAT domain-containing protein [Terriglobales bacterium]